MNNRFLMRFWLIEEKKMVYQPNPEIMVGYPDVAWYCKTLGDKSIQMQCTGRKDKNGILVYEGDILSLDGECFLVKWDEIDDRCVHGHGFNFKSGETFNDMDGGDVVGNIYENPDILTN